MEEYIEQLKELNELVTKAIALQEKLRDSLEKTTEALKEQIILQNRI